MKGKAKEKRKIGKVILIGMGFFLTIILTFTTTLAWFYDSDWASKYINMAGTVGIELRREELDTDEEGANLTTSGAGNLYFTLYNEADNPKAYPGQSIDVSASVYNDGGRSGEGGSDCYVRAHFAVYTNIGIPITIDRNDFPAGTDGDAAYAEAQAKANADALLEEETMGAEALYVFLNTLISKQNDKNAGYYWKYYQHEGATPLSESGTGNDETNPTDIEYYYEGTKVKDSTHDSTNEDATSVTDVTKVLDRGYFYLCHDSSGKLLPLTRTNTAVFLWNDTFVIPWQLTNNSADKILFVALTFQAIQTYIPKISNGIINSDPDNRLPLDECLYNANAVQTVFNSCAFPELNTTINVNGTDITFKNNNNYNCITTPPTT